MAMAEIKVLLVDDEPDFMEPLTNRLTLRKLKVFNATNGADALKLLDQEPVDVVVLDVKMPGMSGLELLGILKKDAELQYIPVMIFSVQNSLESKIDGLGRGAGVYLTKPYESDDLIARVIAMLRSRKLYQSPTSCRIPQQFSLANEKLPKGNNFFSLAFLLNPENIYKCDFFVK